MTSYKRARALLVVAVIFSVATVATGFPLATLLRQRASISAAAGELAEVRAHNAELQGQVAALGKKSTITDIARQFYGLVRPGERAVVILPGGNDHSNGSAALAETRLPAADLAPTSAISLQHPGAGKAPDPVAGVWGRTLHYLEFWRGF